MIEGDGWESVTDLGAESCSGAGAAEEESERIATYTTTPVIALVIPLATSCLQQSNTQVWVLSICCGYFASSLMVSRVSTNSAILPAEASVKLFTSARSVRCPCRDSSSWRSLFDRFCSNINNALMIGSNFFSKSETKASMRVIVVRFSLIRCCWFFSFSLEIVARVSLSFSERHLVSLTRLLLWASRALPCRLTALLRLSICSNN